MFAYIWEGLDKIVSNLFSSFLFSFLHSGALAGSW